MQPGAVLDSYHYRGSNGSDSADKVDLDEDWAWAEVPVDRSATDPVEGLVGRRGRLVVADHFATTVWDLVGTWVVVEVENEATAVGRMVGMALPE